MSAEYDDLDQPRRSGRTRSGAVTAVAIVNYIFGGLNIICGMVILFAGTMVAKFMGAAIKQDPNLDPQAAKMAEAVGTGLGALVIGIAVFTMIMALPMIIAGYGVQQRREWGRILTLVLGGLSGLLALLSLVQFNICGIVMQGGYCALVFAILLQSKYAAEFR
jgi:hypothetical protein